MAETNQEQVVPVEKKTSPAEKEVSPVEKKETEFNEEVQQKGEGAKEAPKANQSILGSLMDNPILLLLIGLWVLVLWTARKSKKKQQEQREQQNNSLNKGAKIVTIGRVHGTVTKVGDKTFTIKTDPNKDYTLTFDREALLRVESSEEPKIDEAEKDKAEPVA